MDIYYSADQCGSGKTKNELDRMANKPGRYVFAVDRTEVIPSRIKHLTECLTQTGLVAHIEVVTADDDTDAVGTVASRIAEAGFDLSQNPHVILFITHAGMMLTRDWSGFHDWDAISIDETPSILDRDDHPAGPFYRTAFERFYGLTPQGNRSLIHFKHGIGVQGLPSEYRAFHGRVVAGEAYCDLTAWHEIENKDRTSWTSWRTWNVNNLAPFKAVRFLADGFDASDTYHLMGLDPTVRFKRFNASSNRVWVQRPVTIRYVSENHRASTTLFRSTAFAPELAKIGKWLSDVPTDRHLWTSNLGLKIDGDIPGLRVTPKQAGVNTYMDWHHVSTIYAAKPSPLERKFFKLLGLKHSIIEQSREGNDIHQFVMRCSLRDPDSVEPVTVKVFDRWQAERIASKLALDYGLHPILEPDDIGLVFRKSKSGRKVGSGNHGQRAQTPEERREKNRLVVADARARAKAGLPPKSKTKTSKTTKRNP